MEKQLKPAEGQIVMANTLKTGVVVFLTADGGWSDDPADAALSDSAEQAADLLARARADEDANRVIGPLLVAAEIRDGKPFPLRNREAIRALGPTVRTDLGYQGEGRGGRHVSL